MFVRKDLRSSDMAREDVFAVDWGLVKAEALARMANRAVLRK